jgi:toxin YoeB
MFDGDVWDDFVELEKNPQLKKRFYKVLKDTRRTPFTGIGKPEPLKGDLAGHWSRRIDDSYRFVYRVEADMIVIVQCGNHYED